MFLTFFDWSIVHRSIEKKKEKQTLSRVFCGSWVILLVVMILRRVEGKKDVMWLAFFLYE